jgi:hypothetical protein
VQDFLRRARGVAKVVREVVEKFLNAHRRFQSAQLAQLGWCEPESVSASHGRNIAQSTRSSNISQSSAWSLSLRKREGEGEGYAWVSARSRKPLTFILSPSKGERRDKASQPHCSMLNDHGAPFVFEMHEQRIKAQPSMWPDYGLPRQPS